MLLWYRRGGIIRSYTANTDLFNYQANISVTWLFHRHPIFWLYNVFTHEKKYSHDRGVAQKRQGCVKGLLHYEAQKDGPFCYLFYIAEMNPSISVVCFLISL